MRRKHPRHRSIKKSGNRGFRSTLFQYILIGIVILCGVIWGSILARQTGITKQSGFGILVQETLSKDAASKGFFNLLFSSFFSSALLLCTAFVLGLCALGSPGHLAVLLFKGAGIGLSMGYIYIQYGGKGFAICAIFILPGAAITSLAVMLACREGMRFSFFMARAVLPSGGKQQLWNEFCDYCLKYVVCFVLVLIASVIQAFSTVAFSMLFFS